MIITNHGKQFFKIQQGDTVLAFNPISKESKAFDKTKFGSSVVFSSINHADYNGIENASYGDNKPFVISGPGDYEVSDILIKGFGVESKVDGKKYYNTIYKVLFEGINIIFLGVVSGDIDPKIKEELGDPDILFVPIDGNNSIDPAKAHKLATNLEAKLVIPMDYDKANLAQFLKESGDDVKPEEKITIKKKELSEMKGSVRVLK